jgi:hypothetical protein
MKITKTQLKQIVKEELEGVLNEDMMSTQNQKDIKTLVAQAAAPVAKNSGHTGPFASWKPSQMSKRSLERALSAINGVQMAAVYPPEKTAVIRFTKSAAVVPGSYTLRFGDQEADFNTGLSIIEMEY